MILDRRLKSSVHVVPWMRTVFRMSRPASMACVRYGETSSAVIGMPVLWAIVREEDVLFDWL